MAKLLDQIRDKIQWLQLEHENEGGKEDSGGKGDIAGGRDNVLSRQ